MKKLIIDGHNLIPKIPGLHLKDVDDEARLTEIIQEYCRLVRRQAELFFDGSPEPKVNSRKNGLVHVHFIKLGYSADDAIIHFMRDHQHEKANLILVSSDHRVQNAGLATGCEVVGSDVFARSMNTVFSSETAVQQWKEKPLSTNEVEEWLNLFDGNKNS
jgi:predicted RNA-binding protein with PIN domain